MSIIVVDQLEMIENRGLRINLGKQSMVLVLLPERVVYIPSLNALLIADTHFGKAGHFRKAGIPIPEVLHDQDLKKLEKLISSYQINDVYFLGDLFHSALNDSWWTLVEFSKQQINVKFHLIMGNHDILPLSFYQHDHWIVHEQGLILGDLILTHEPLENIPRDLINLCGHIHPGFTLKGKGRQRITLPCFFYSNQRFVLPAFGRFTGLVSMKRTIDTQIYVIAEDRVVEIPQVL
ncbi:ligase-associated DNA damage response endonuclease PdeM [Belliella sp. DSM 111904]|uniref:Ligase-associated DNA damage response endonuclease PdeM n=1 Tax=Belliella filtrata TaxID=2923435 RepID=A0ABS9V2A2_9BACT|nr:ligase-associated DNA damage response endonuclease PdeM [Belliella filtrata]MCH7410503.1 ligase-associated DNA damage response endonuclease PdeM [Belliella filtrata]